MKTFEGIEELRAAVGTHVGYSPWHTVTQEQVDLFADATGDHQWIHVDPVRATDSPFGTTIAHGYLTLSLVPLLVQQVYATNGLQMALNYGANKVRFPSPVPVGSRIRAGVEFTGLTPGGGSEVLTSKVVVEIDGTDKPACVVETLTVLVP